MQNIQDELNALKPLVEQLSGLSSRWSGYVVVLDSAQVQTLTGRSVFAEKRWNCDILINSDIIGEPWRWRTYLHEMLHSVSVGLRQEDYRRLRGWEEGVVEWLQREWRPQVLSALGENVSDAVFKPLETFWAFNGYLEALEMLQQESELDAKAFYANLLRHPLAQRPAYVYSLNKTAEYRRLLAVVSGRLR